jgi:hypothetical protein
LAKFLRYRCQPQLEARCDGVRDCGRIIVTTNVSIARVADIEFAATVTLRVRVVCVAHLDIGRTKLDIGRNKISLVLLFLKRLDSRRGVIGKTLGLDERISPTIDSKKAACGS